MIDLHVHTNKSDGQYSPSEIVVMAAKKGIEYLAITDHDVLTGLAEGESCAAKAGIHFCPGIEISVEGNRELHVLGYNIDYTNESLVSLCENFIRLREQREGKIFNYLRSYGIELSEEEVKRHSTHGLAGRPHFARAMVEAGYVKTIQEAFDKYLGTDEFSSVERTKPSAQDGIEAIRHAGGTPVLAHPVLLNLDDHNLDKLVSDLKTYGLVGIECFYSTHTSEQVTHYLELAKRYDLLVTCGSDFHGEQSKPGIELGDGARYLNRDAKDIFIKLLDASH